MTLVLVLDIALGVALLLRTIAGWRTGLAGGIPRVIGLVLGGVGGLWLGPKVLRWLQREAFSAQIEGTEVMLRFLVLIGCLMAGIAIGESIGAWIGHRIRRAMGPKVSRGDAVAGSLTALVASALVVWLLAATLRPMLPTQWASAVNDSKVLRGIDAVVPDQLNALPPRLTAGLRTQWPRVFGGLTPEPRIEADSPDTAIAKAAAITKAAPSIIKITTDAPKCVSDSAGSGWVVARERVVTNAHVVAGSSEVTVQVTGRGPALRATVVAFDPDLDLAILAVPGLTSAPLPRATGAAQQSVVAAGFPGGGSYTLAPSRIRGTMTVTGDDIHGRAGIARQVHAVRGIVRPGNSGGPLLNEQAGVVGTVFAGSTLDPDTYYVLTEKATQPMLDRAASLSAAVSTQGCAVG